MSGRIGDKIILSIMFFLLTTDCYAGQETWLLVAILLALIGTCFLEIFREEPAVLGLGAVVSGLTIWEPLCVGALLAAIYGVYSTQRMERVQSEFLTVLKSRLRADGSMKNAGDIRTKVMEKQDRWYLIRMNILGGLLLAAGVARTAVERAKEGEGLYLCVAFSCFAVLAVFLAVKGSLEKQAQRNYYEDYDQARMELLNARQSRDQIERQKEDSVYMATLQERNRIAREIHDNVGHMLTRAIVQMQAIKVINRDENIKPHLDSVDETINQAMLNIRRSVHELHDDSIDLSIMLNEIVKALPEQFQVDCRTSIESSTDTELKNAILAIVREAVTNIAKYSKGDYVKVEIIEHAAFWRIYVHDNGANPKKDYDREIPNRSSSEGMGLSDLYHRAKKMNGNISISSGPEGFDVLTIIPKKQGAV